MLLGVQCSQLGPEDSAAHKFSFRGRKSACRSLSSRLLQTNEIMNDSWLAAGNNGIDPQLCYGPHTHCCTGLQSHRWSLRTKRKKETPKLHLADKQKATRQTVQGCHLQPRGVRKHHVIFTAHETAGGRGSDIWYPSPTRLSPSAEMLTPASDCTSGGLIK